MTWRECFVRQWYTYIRRARTHASPLAKELANTRWILLLRYSVIITCFAIRYDCNTRCTRHWNNDMRTAYVQRFRRSVPGTYSSQSPLPIRSLKITKGPPNFTLLHLDEIWVFGWITGNLSSSSTKELKFPDIQPNSRYWTRTKYPPFMKFKGVQGISRTIMRNELIWGCLHVGESCSSL
jgi:hypothetical protein